MIIQWCEAPYDTTACLRTSSHCQNHPWTHYIYTSILLVTTICQQINQQILKTRSNCSVQEINWLQSNSIHTLIIIWKHDFFFLLFWNHKLWCKWKHKSFLTHKNDEASFSPQPSVVVWEMTICRRRTCWAAWYLTSSRFTQTTGASLNLYWLWRRWDCASVTLQLCVCVCVCTIFAVSCLSLRLRSCHREDFRLSSSLKVKAKSPLMRFVLHPPQNIFSFVLSPAPLVSFKNTVHFASCRFLIFGLCSSTLLCMFCNHPNDLVNHR